MIAIYYSRINRLYTIKQTEIDKNWQSISEQVKNHISANTLPIVAVTKALLKQNESAYFCQPAVMYKHQTTHYDKSGAGINLSIAKGVKVGTGGGRSRAVKDYVPISDGELVFTNTRVIFAGNLKSFECKLANLISYEAVGNGFIFQVGAKTHMAALSNARSHQSARAILEHLINKHLG